MDSGFLLGSWVGLMGLGDETRADGGMWRGGLWGSKCQRRRPFDSVAMLPAFGRRYPLPRAHRCTGGLS